MAANCRFVSMITGTLPEKIDNIFGGQRCTMSKHLHRNAKRCEFAFGLRRYGSEAARIYGTVLALRQSDQKSTVALEPFYVGVHLRNPAS